ncbi:hypothetical protein KEM54_005221 [Ascosphaera aggregata]|nr:hypothetical protein KEM54_005221 [Ascosphaera aggregata]
MDITYQQVLLMIYKFLMGIIQRVLGGAVRVAARTAPFSWLLGSMRVVMPYLRVALGYLRTGIREIINGLTHIMTPVISSQITIMLLVYLRELLFSLITRAMAIARRILGLAFYIIYASARSAIQQTMKVPPMPQIKTATGTTQEWLTTLLDMLMKIILDALRRYLEPSTQVEIIRAK